MLTPSYIVGHVGSTTGLPAVNLILPPLAGREDRRRNSKSHGTGLNQLGLHLIEELVGGPRKRSHPHPLLPFSTALCTPVRDAESWRLLEMK